jgi:hypothetical protein
MNCAAFNEAITLFLFMLAAAAAEPAGVWRFEEAMRAASVDLDLLHNSSTLLEAKDTSMGCYIHRTELFVDMANIRSCQSASAARSGLSPKMEESCESRGVTLEERG